MEDIGLDINLYAKIMANTLADMYWKAHVDVSDMEFVLAPLRKEVSHTGDGESQPRTIKSEFLWYHVANDDRS